MRRNENYVDYDNEKKPIPWNRLFLSLLGIVLVILLVLLFMKFCGKKSLQPDLLKAGKEYYEKNPSNLPNEVGSCNTVSLKQLEDTVEELESTIIGSSKITGMPTTINGSSSPTERIGIKLAQLKSKIETKKETLIDEAHKIEDFLTTVDEEEIRIIIRERFLNGKTWEEVAKKIITDRSTPYYKLKNYLKGRAKSEKEESK